MSNEHKNKTMSFRPDEWERILIEERAALSGMLKKDFITRSCIYSNICVVGSKENIKKIVDAVYEMKYTMVEISGSIATGDFPLSEDVFTEMVMRYCAACNMIVEILDGAAYLFDKESPVKSSVLERKEHLHQLLSSLESPNEDGDSEQVGDKKGTKI